MLVRKRKIVSAMTLTMLLASMLTLTSKIVPVKASGTIYIRADGSIDPLDAPISTVDYVTYTLTGSITSDADGIVVERSNIIIDGADHTVEGTGTYPYKGIYLSGIANVTIKNTNVKHFDYGIGLYSSSSNSIVENEITNNSYGGIGLFGSSGKNSIYGNNITNNGPSGNYGGVGWAGIELSSSSGRNSIYRNNITNNPSGIHLYGTSYNNIYGNDLIINGYGISISSSSNNIIYKNNIANSDNLAGIWLQWSSYNNIYGNNITNNKDGIELYSSYSNNIYHNNFINNTRQIDTTPTYVNTWDNGYPSGGNYWSDYHYGVDEKSGPNQDQPGSDSIGDWPYVINGDNRDRYPLMSPSTPPPPMFVTETIYIRADGSVDPPTAPIQRDREIYTLTQDVIAYADGILIERSNIIIDGAGCWLWGNGSGSGFSLHSLNNVTIKNIRIEGFYDGVHLDLTSRIVLFENRIISNGGSGIMIEDSDNIALTGNAITHNAYELGSLPPQFAGILLVNTTNSQIANNNITDNLNGIYLYRSSNSTIFGNTMTTNLWQGSILLEWSSNNTISRNDIRTGGSGIVVKGSSDNNVISENNVANNMFHGIRLLDSSNNTLSQNIMNGNEYGFGVEGSILSNFIHSIDTSNLVDGKPIHYLLNLNDLMIDPVTHPEIGYLAIINCTNITAEGLNLTSKWQGLLLAYTKDSRITNNNVTNNLWCGIQLIVSNNNTISRNSITNTDGAGIKIFYSSNDNTISENKVTDNRENGIELYGSSDNLIFGNNVTNNDQYGVVQFYSYDNTISRNNIENEKGGIGLVSSSNNTISENNITNNEQGVWLHGSSITKLRNNHMSGNRWSFGVDGDTLEHFVHDVDASNTVDGKPIYYWVNRQGETIPTGAGYVALVNSTNITVQSLNLENNFQGLLLAYTENSTIRNNHITNNYDGIDLAYSSSSSISGNNIENNSRYGVCLLDSSDNEIFVNNMEKNTYGIVAVYSSHNTVFGNNIENGWLGIYLEGSSNNRIFHNNFINNTRQAYSYASMNIWDDGYASGGNCWSDYTGEDLYGGSYQNMTGSDGIGDTPYVIDANNQDRYPLMNPYVLLGDLNNDGVTNILDMVIFGKAYGSYPGHPRWNPAADLDDNGIINILDCIIIAKNFGKKW